MEERGGHASPASHKTSKAPHPEIAAASSTAAAVAVAAPPTSPLKEEEEQQGKLLRAEVASLRQQLAEIEARRARVQRRRERVAAEREALRAWGTAWWGRVNAQAAALGTAEAALASARREGERREERLRTLARTHVLDDAFFVWHAGPFATINGLKLGRLPAVYPVDWSDVNAGLGQAVLLLACLAERCGYRFQQHQLLPMGSFAKIGPAPPASATAAKAGSGAVGGLAAATFSASPSTASTMSSSLSLSSTSSSSSALVSALSGAPAAGAAAPPLLPQTAAAAAGSSSSSSSSSNLSNLHYEEGFAFFRRQGFNRALQAFLRCVHELGEFAERRDPALRLPYRIQYPQDSQPGSQGQGQGQGQGPGPGPGTHGPGTVGGLPLQFAPGSEEAWTRALKYLATDLKWLVAWSAKHT